MVADILGHSFWNAVIPTKKKKNCQGVECISLAEDGYGDSLF